MPRRRPPRAEDALARVVLDRYLAVRRGEAVTIETWSHALNWARALVVETRRRGARPALIVEDEDAFFRSIESVGASSVPGGAGGPVGRGGAHIYLDGPEEFPRLLGLPPDARERLLARHGRAWWRTARRQRVRALRIVVGDATPTAAIRYGVDHGAWQTELLRASLVDPTRLTRSAAGISRALARARRLRIRHPNGTDLLVERSDRAPIVDAGPPDPSAGRVWGRVPSGLLIVPLRAGSVEGSWESNRPAYDRYAQPPVAIGARFSFHAGRLTEFTFDRGGAPFAAAYARAGPRRERPIALTVGLNPAVSHAPELQELGEGTLGLLLGDAPFRSDSGRPGFSFLAALAGGNVEADGRPWLSGGRLAPPAEGVGPSAGGGATRRTGRRTP
jgi:hypothetical protein